MIHLAQHLTPRRNHAISSIKHPRRNTLFFTVVTYDRNRLLCVNDNPARLREAMESVKAVHPFAIDAIVLLPDHLHCIWTLPPQDNGFSKKWMLIKGKFTRKCDNPFTALAGSSRLHKREQTIWQRETLGRCYLDCIAELASYRNAT
jgi:REP element-mobilizing transposase RayT